MDNPLHPAPPTHPSLTKSPSSTGSFQGHLSTANSQQRLRAINSYGFPSSLPIRAFDPELNDAHVLSQNSILVSFVHAFFPPVPSNLVSFRVRPWPTLALKWAACVYFCLCMVFLSVAIYKHIRHRETAPKELGSSFNDSRSKKLIQHLYRIKLPFFSTSSIDSATPFKNFNDVSPPGGFRLCPHTQQHKRGRYNSVPVGTGYRN
jgi:hypothetical protein